MATTRTMTIEELWDTEDDGSRHELIKGELVSMPPAGEAPGHLMGKLSHLIWRYLEDHPTAILAVGDSGYVLDRNPDTLLAPDLAMTRIERIPDEVPARSFPNRAPDLVIEIVSPGDRIGTINEKLRLYLEFGVELIWLVDPDRRTVTAHAYAKPVRLLQSGDSLTADELFPGLRIQVDEIF